MREEQDAGLKFGLALLALPPIRWEAALVAHPEWLRVGTMRYLLQAARDIAESDSARGRAITHFVLTHLKDVPQPPFTSVLVQPLEGEAFIAHGEVLLADGDASGALQAAVIAEALLGRALTGHMEVAHAQLLRAKACGALHRDGEALDVIDEALRVFGSMGDTRDYNRALFIRAELLCDMCQWAEASRTLRAAERIVSSRHCDSPAADDLRVALKRCRVLGLPTADSPANAC